MGGKGSKGGNGRKGCNRERKRRELQESEIERGLPVRSSVRLPIHFPLSPVEFGSAGTQLVYDWTDRPTDRLFRFLKLELQTQPASQVTKRWLVGYMGRRKRKRGGQTSILRIVST